MAAASATGYLNIAQSSDGERIAAISRDNMIRVWRRGAKGVDVFNNGSGRSDRESIRSATSRSRTARAASACSTRAAHSRPSARTRSHRSTRSLSPAGTRSPGPTTAACTRSTSEPEPSRRCSCTTRRSDRSPRPRTWSATLDAAGTLFTFDGAHIVDPMSAQPHRGQHRPDHGRARRPAGDRRRRSHRARMERRRLADRRSSHSARDRRGRDDDLDHLRRRARRGPRDPGCATARPRRAPGLLGNR